MILIPFLISMLYCCAFATFLVSILYFCDFATFSDFNMMLLWFCYLFSFEFYLFIYNMILMWFWYDIVAQASAQSVTLVPVGFDVPMKKPRKLRQAQGRWRCSRCKAGLDSNNEPIEKGDGAALEQGRWREIREDYPEQRKEVWNACYSYLLFFSCFSCLFKTYWGHVDVWESDCVACVGGGIGLSNSFSSVLPFSFPTSKLGIMQEYGVRFHAPTQH